MPTTYAHYIYGQEVLSKLSDKEVKIIKDNIDIFNWGVYGPDILYYYNPYWPNRINKMGGINHHSPFIEFLKYSADRINMIKDDKDKDACMAYMYGFICHFALDSYCHGYVNYTKKQTGLGHNRMEAEFDRFLMIRDGHDPITFEPIEHMNPDSDIARQISLVYPKVNQRIAYKVIKYFKKMSKMVVAPTKLSRILVYTFFIITGNYPSKEGMIIRHKPEKRCEATNKELYRLYNKSMNVAVELIEAFEENVTRSRRYSKIYTHTFSTKVVVENELDADLRDEI